MRRYVFACVGGCDYFFYCTNMNSGSLNLKAAAAATVAAVAAVALSLYSVHPKWC